MNIKYKYNNFVNKYLKNKIYLNSSISITDNSHMEIENCSKILEYNDIYVRLKTATIFLQIWGEGLMISDYNTSGIIVDGKIFRVEFD